MQDWDVVGWRLRGGPHVATTPSHAQTPTARNQLSTCTFHDVCVNHAVAAMLIMQGDVPGYCGDRYFRAMAGGQYCDKYDVK